MLGTNPFYYCVFFTSFKPTTRQQSASRQSVFFETCMCIRCKGVYEVSHQQLSLLSTALCVHAFATPYSTYQSLFYTNVDHLTACEQRVGL